MKTVEASRSRLRKVSLALAGCVVGLLAAEIVLRVLGVSYPALTAYDSTRGMVLRPGASGWFREEGEAYIQYNRDGLRDREHSTSKPPNTYRIAILGDSYAEADQVPMEETFWSHAQHELDSCPGLNGRRVEVINFGVSGYGTAQELLTLRCCVWKYDPDLVLLAFVPGNDVRNNSRALEPGNVRPFFFYEGGKLVEDKSFLESKIYRTGQSFLWRSLRRISDYSRIVQLAIRMIKLRVNKKQAENQKASRQQESGLSNAIYREPLDPDWKEAWRVTEGLISLMNKEVRERGASFLVVTLSDAIQVDPDSRVRKKFADQMGIPNLFYPDERVRALGIREGIDVLSLALPFQSYAETNKVTLHGFPNTAMGTGHWNAHGHRLAGTMIAAHLCKALETPASDRAQE